MSRLPQRGLITTLRQQIVNNRSALSDELKLAEENSDLIKVHPERFLTATVCSRPTFFQKFRSRAHECTYYSQFSWAYVKKTYGLIKVIHVKWNFQIEPELIVGWHGGVVDSILGLESGSLVRFPVREKHCLPEHLPPFPVPMLEEPPIEVPFLWVKAEMMHPGKRWMKWLSGPISAHFWRWSGYKWRRKLIVVTYIFFWYSVSF